jgi:hypothetical protein
MCWQDSRLTKCAAALISFVAIACSSAAVLAPSEARAAPGSQVSVQAPTSTEGGSLEAAASKASSTGRKVAMSLIGLALAIVGVVLAFRRNFREAAGVFAIGLVAVLFATSAGLHVLQNTVSSLFGSQ